MKASSRRTQPTPGRDRKGANLAAPRRRKSEESGFALLLVFLMAAFIAINLYMELPRVAFEAQRQKEQMLMERGEQYKRAIGVFVRTNKRWPATIDELENMNNRRYLRKRYIDPMTGKDEWRLVHIANGVLTDSVTNKKKDDQNQHLSASNAVMELAGVGGLDSSGQQGPNAANRRRVSEGGVQLGPDGQPLPAPVAGYPQPNGSGAPLDAGGSVPGVPGASGATGSTGGVPPGSGAPGVAGGAPSPFPANGVAGLLGIPTAPTGATGATGATGTSAPLNYGLGNGIAAVGGGTPTTSPTPGALPGNLSSSTPGGIASLGGGGLGGAQYGATPGQGMTQSSLTAANPGLNVSPQAQQAAANLIQGLLTQPRPGGAAGLPTAGGAGAVMGSGIAGVASKAKGDSIMVYYDQTNYSDWEFLYDPMKFAVPPNPNTGSSVGTPASQLGSSAGSPTTLNQNGTPAAAMSSPIGGAAGPGGAGAFGGPGGASAFGASGGAPSGSGGGTSGTGTPSGTAGMPSSSSAFGQAGPPDIRPGKK